MGYMSDDIPVKDRFAYSSSALQIKKKGSEYADSTQSWSECRATCVEDLQDFSKWSKTNLRAAGVSKMNDAERYEAMTDLEKARFQADKEEMDERNRRCAEGNRGNALAGMTNAGALEELESTIKDLSIPADSLLVIGGSVSGTFQSHVAKGTGGLGAGTKSLDKNERLVNQIPQKTAACLIFGIGSDSNDGVCVLCWVPSGMSVVERMKASTITGPVVTAARNALGKARVIKAQAETSAELSDINEEYVARQKAIVAASGSVGGGSSPAEASDNGGGAPAPKKKFQPPAGAFRMPGM